MVRRSIIARGVFALGSAAAMVAAVAESGCASNSGPPTTQSMAARQDRAIADPMGYEPPQARSVDGGSTGAFDRKGIGQDMNDLINP